MGRCGGVALHVEDTGTAVLTKPKMRTMNMTPRKALLFLALALVGCAERSNEYPCAVVQERNNTYKYVYGDSVKMLTTNHAIAYREGPAIVIKDNETRLHVECDRRKPVPVKAEKK